MNIGAIGRQFEDDHQDGQDHLPHPQQWDEDADAWTWHLEEQTRPGGGSGGACFEVEKMKFQMVQK